MIHSPPLLLEWPHDPGLAKLENSILSALVIDSGQSWPLGISYRIAAAITNKGIFFPLELLS